MEHPDVLKEHLASTLTDARVRLEQQRLAAERLAQLVSGDLEVERAKKWIEEIEEWVLEAAKEGENTVSRRLSWDHGSEARWDRERIAIARDYFAGTLTITVEDRDSPARTGSDGLICVDAYWGSDIQISFGEEQQTATAQGSTAAAQLD